MTSDLIKKRLAERTLRLAEVQQRAALKAAAEASLKAYGEGHVDQAREGLEKVLEIDPDQPDALQLKALIALDRQEYQTAEALFARAIELKPDFALAHYNRGNGLRETDNLPQAAASYLKTIELAPGFPDAYGNLGLTYLLLSEDDKAIEYLTKAIALKPDYAHALNNLGNVLRRQGKPEEAAALFNRAVVNEPGFSLGYNNLGNALRDLGRLDEAIAAFEKARTANPGLAEAHYNLGLAHLLTGDFAAGWHGYQWRHQIPGGPPAADHITQPDWDGGSFADKTLYLHPEQGLGDVIQFCRYVPLVAGKGGRIILRVPSSLAEIMRSLEGVDEMILENDPEPPAFDYHASLMDLPRLHGTDQQTIPDTCPYLQTDPSRVAKWAGRLGDKSTFRLGLVWAGQPLHDNDRNRSMDPQLLLPLSEIEGLSLFSLQMGQDGQAVSVFGERITDLAPDIDSWSDTAAIIDNLDLVLSVDTSVVHMAGAIGSRVWTMLPFMPDWRWQLTRTDTPWYPTMRLFRQPGIGDWSSVIDSVAAELKAML